MQVIALVFVFVVPEEGRRCSVVVPPPSAAARSATVPAPAATPDAAREQELALAYRRQVERSELATVRPGRRFAVEVVP